MVKRVALIGTGFVGSSYAFALVNQALTEELVLIDINKEKAQGEAVDLQDASVFAPLRTKVWAGDYHDCKDADIVCITAGKSQLEMTFRMEALEHTVEIYKAIVDNVMSSGFDGMILVASNPLDIAAYAAYKFSGLPREKVMGTGTLIDTARYRFELGKYVDVNPESINGYVIGEHGPSQVAAISSTTIGGKPVTEMVEKSRIPELENVATTALHRGGAIRNGKGATAYGIAMAMTTLTRAIAKNENVVLPVSVLLDGEYEHRDVYAGVPALINREGMKEIIEIPLNTKEVEEFAQSIQSMKKHLETVSPIING